MFEKLKQTLKGWRTVVLNSVAGLAPILLLVLDYAGTVDASSLLSAKGALVYGIAVHLANIYLRTITNTPVGKAD